MIDVSALHLVFAVIGWLDRREREATETFRVGVRIGRPLRE